MARARLLKPGFFANEKLTEVNAFGRLLFAGLWTVADREGRMKDSAKWIKGAVFPYENVAVERLLDELAVRGFIIRYEVEGERYIQITNFAKHQHVHIKEQPSTYPAPDLHPTSPEISETSPAVTTSTSKAEAVPEAVTEVAPESADPMAGPPVPPLLNIFREAEKAFGRPMSPYDIDALKDLEKDFPEDTWRYALRQASDMNKRNIKYVQAICTRVGDGDPDEQRTDNRAPRFKQAGGPAADPMADIERRMQERRPERVPG